MTEPGSPKRVPFSPPTFVTDADDFFARNTVERPEVIEGLLREGQLATFAGAFGMGKSPVLADLTVCFIHGHEWCGRKVERRPVIAIDCETPGPEYRRAINAIAARFKLSVPRVPEQLEIYLERDDPKERYTATLLDAVSREGHDSKLHLLREALHRKPNAIVSIDPLEMFFRLDTCKKQEVIQLYRDLRTMLSEFPHAVLLNTFNLRKRDLRARKANLLSDPRDWLQEVCGSLDLMNRADVRLGIDEHDEDVRVINGVVRTREMHPLLIRPFRDKDEQLAGFVHISPSAIEAMVGLSQKQKAYWASLPDTFTFEEIAGRSVPRSSLSRLINRMEILGALVRVDGTCHKTV